MKRILFTAAMMMALYAIPTQAQSTFQVSGKVWNLDRTAGVPGVHMVFALMPGQDAASCPVPTPAITNPSGVWVKGPFKSGCKYKVTPNKPGFRFRLAFQQFSTASTSIFFYQS